MHILVLPSWFEDARHPTLGSFFKDQTRALKLSGAQTGIIFPIPISVRMPQYYRKATQYHDESSGFPILTNSYFTLPKLRNYNLHLRFKNFEILFKRYIEKYGIPDLLHAHSCALGPFGSAGQAARIIAKKYNLPYIITEHGSSFHTGYYRQGDIKGMLQAFEDADHLFAVSESLKQDLLEFGVKREIEVLGNIVDSETYQPTKSVKCRSGFRFIVVAYLRPIKRIDKIIKAFAAVKQQVQDVQLQIVGDGEQRKELEQLSRSLNLAEHVEFCGELQRDGVVKAMSDADCYIMLSDYETFSVVVHEALSAGLSVISNQCGGPVDTLKHLKQTIIENTEVDTLAGAMLSKAKTAKMTDIQQQFNHQYIANNFSYSAVGKSLLNVAQKCTSKTNS